MTSLPRRDPVADALMTPENSALLVIDYQPTQIASIQSITHPLLVQNVGMTIQLAKAYHVPIILSTVNVTTGRNKDTIAPLKQLLGDTPSLDRTSINAWEDAEFRAAVQATGRTHLVIAALWTEACLTFPALDALREQYHVHPVVDAVGGTSTIAHETALARIAQAGGELTTNAQLACEWQRDWNRGEFVPQFVDLLLQHGQFVNY
ncbi:isochorismatase family protein [Lacticaseibacillus daqingensis]|uniref:isochorismatase family protein n=1 Tax=Lacticaseibacillus daqingensis TaxID=2486014 RepID=UPI000F767EBC|nr:isochorismatase family protein [Lacticaseibacillus daqingensis]